MPGEDRVVPASFGTDRFQTDVIYLGLQDLGDPVIARPDLFLDHLEDVLVEMVDPRVDNVANLAIRFLSDSGDPFILEGDDAILRRMLALGDEDRRVLVMMDDPGDGLL